LQSGCLEDEQGQQQELEQGGGGAGGEEEGRGRESDHHARCHGERGLLLRPMSAGEARQFDTLVSQVLLLMRSGML